MDAPASPRTTGPRGGAGGPARLVLLLALGGVLAGCSGGPGSTRVVLPDAATSAVSVAPAGGLLADGVASAAVTVVVRDASGHPLAGSRVSLSASGSGNLLGQPGKTDATGTAVGSIASTTAELKALSASVGAPGGDLALADMPQVEFVAGPTSLSAVLSSAAAAPASGVVADGSASSTITVTVRDASSSPVPGLLVQLATDGGGNTLVQPAGPTDANGMATGTIASTVAETKTLTITVDPAGAALELTTHPTVSFVGDPSTIDPALSSAAASPAIGIVADGATTSTLTVTVRDANGNPVEGQTVSLAATGTGNTLVQPAAATDAGGVATATLASTVAETKTITVTVDPGPGAVVLADSPTAVFVGDPSTIDPALSSVSAAPPDGSLADGSDEVGVDVVVRDRNGNPVAGQTVDLSASGQGNTLAQPGPTDSSGTAHGSLHTIVAERKLILATVAPGATAVVLDDQPEVSFVWPEGDKRYVRRTGSDTNGGTGPNDAWASVSHAAATAGPGTTILVGAGTYVGMVLFTTDGTASQPIRLVADTSGAETGDAGEVVLDGGGAHDAVQIDGADHVVIDGFTITGADPAGTEGACVRVGDTPTTGVILRNDRIYGGRRGVYGRKAGALVVESDSISGGTSSLRAAVVAGGGEGIVLDDCDGADLRNDLIYANQGEGVRVTGGSTGLVVEACTLYRNGRDEISADGLLNSAVTRRNVMSEGSGNGISLVLGSLLSSTYDLVWGHIGLNWLGLSLGLGDLSSPPLFLDPFGPDGILGGAGAADDDFELDAVTPSPAIDAGGVDASAVVLTDGTNLAQRSTGSSGALDGEQGNGGALDLGYHYPAAFDDLSATRTDDLRIVYAQDGEARARHRAWSDASGTGVLAAEGLAPPAGSTLRWLRHEVSPLDDGEELLLALSDAGVTSDLLVLRWSGAAWSRDVTATGVGLPAEQGADLAYDEAGNALLVFSDGGANPRWLRRSQGAWSSEAALFTTAPGAAAVQWVELVPGPAAGETTLLYADASGALFAVAWTGTAWDEANATMLTGALRTLQTRPFDVVAGSAGIALAVWSETGAAMWSSRASGSPSWSAPAAVGLATPPAALELAADPGSDRVALVGLGDAAGGDQPVAAMWNGLAWSDATSLEAGGPGAAVSAGELPVAVGWLGVSGKAVALYADDAGGALDWALWTSGAGWALQPDVPWAAKGVTVSVRAAALAGEDRLLALLSDDTDGLFLASWDGTSWTLEGSGAALSGTLASPPGVPFDLAVERP